MDNGASNYRRYLDGDDEGLTEIIREYKDSLLLFINGYVKNIFVADDLTEETFFTALFGQKLVQNMAFCNST